MGYDTNGNIYACGIMLSDANIDGKTFPITGSGVYIFKLTANGDLVWFKNYGNTDIAASYGPDMIINNDKVYCSVEFALGGLTSLSVEDTTINLGNAEFGKNLLLSFSTDGEFRWAKNHGASDISSGNYFYWGSGISSSRNGFYMNGTLGESVIFDSDTVKGNSSLNHFIAKYDSLGAVEWVKVIQKESFDFNYNEIGTDENDNVYIQGAFSDNISVDSIINLSSNGGTDLYLAKFLSNGDLEWAKKMDAGYSFTRVMEVMGNNSVYIGGEIDGRYYSDSFTGQTYFGKSFIAEICEAPTTLSQPAGQTEAIKGDTTNYKAQIVSGTNLEWKLSPENAGEINVIKSDSISIYWTDSFEGNAELTITASNGCGSVSSEPLTIAVVANEVTAIVDQLNNKLRIYPNPTSGTLHLKVKEDLQVQRVSILSIGGQVLMQSEKLINNQIDVSSFKKGIYFIKIDSNLGIVNYKFVKE